MNFDFNSLSQNQKYQLYAAGVMLISIFLPWWSSSYSMNVSAMGQSYGSSASNALTGFQLSGGVIPLITVIAATFFLFNNQRYVIWCGVLGLVFAANTFFGIVPIGQNDVSVSLGSMGGACSRQAICWANCCTTTWNTASGDDQF